MEVQYLGSSGNCPHFLLPFERRSQKSVELSLDLISLVAGGLYFIISLDHCESQLDQNESYLHHKNI